MDIKGKVVVVTGAAEGIGEALARGAHKRGAKAVIVADCNMVLANKVAQSIGGRAVACDVGIEADVKGLIEETEAREGPIALFCSNAGIGGSKSDPANAAAVPDEAWQRAWAVNVMSHVYAARHLVPRMIGRGGGYLMNTVSAAGLLNQIGSAIYATTKHAAVGFAENIAITHRDQGIRVSILCPQAVDTTLLREAGVGSQNVDGVLTPEACADVAYAGILAETFCILPHPQVDGYMKAKTTDYNRWIGGMAKLQRNLAAAKVKA
jgi:NAD(P)-dependent dehydrogenase (short-subunit alcohol dehydrogenase family)